MSPSDNIKSFELTQQRLTGPVNGSTSLPLSLSTALSVARLPPKMEMWRPAGASGEDRGNTTSWREIGRRSERRSERRRR